MAIAHGITHTFQLETDFHPAWRDDIFFSPAKSDYQILLDSMEWNLPASVVYPKTHLHQDNGTLKTSPFWIQTRMTFLKEDDGQNL